MEKFNAIVVLVLLAIWLAAGIGIRETFDADLAWSVFGGLAVTLVIFLVVFFWILSKVDIG